MCRPIRSLTEAKGYDASQHILACFGGAGNLSRGIFWGKIFHLGGQHACAIARSLGMRTVFIHRFAGILSAYGLGLADVVSENQEPCALHYNNENLVKVFFFILYFILYLFYYFIFYFLLFYFIFFIFFILFLFYIFILIIFIFSLIYIMIYIVIYSFVFSIISYV